VNRAIQARVAQAALHAFMEPCTPGEDLAHIRRWGRDILCRSGPEAAARLAETGAAFDLGHRLGEIRLPTLLLHSRHDRIVPLALSEELAARLPNSTLVVIESESHVPTMTHADEVAAAIDAFFRHGSLPETGERHPRADKRSRPVDSPTERAAARAPRPDRPG
jgi:pimeloyl-ACP methyl ester carboxylesterase